MDDTDPYPALMGLDWAIEMGGVINLKTRSMIFENVEIRVIVPLDPVEGQGYAEKLQDDKGGNLYTIST